MEYFLIHLSIDALSDIVKTQRNSTELNSTQSNSKATSLRLDIAEIWYRHSLNQPD